MTVPTLALPVVDTTAGITLPVTPPVVPPVVEGRFTAADIEAARKQEKDKLYQTQIAANETWEKKFMEQGQVLADLLKAKDVDVKAAAAEATKAAEEAAAKNWEEKDSKTLVADVRAELEAKLAEMAKQNDLERETFAKERSFTELRDYTQKRVSEAVAANEVAPELVGYVTGNNTAEIDASLIRVKATTETLLSSFAEATAATTAAIPPVPRGVSPTGYTPAGPMDADPSHQTFSAQDIKDMSMEEYATKRGAFLGAAAQSGRDRGMFA